MKSLVCWLIFLGGTLSPAWSHAQSISAVLGSAAVTLDPVKVAQVKAGVYGTRFYYDTNSDGKMDECWFIDIDPRHTSANKPILVKVIDTSGNLAVGVEPSHASAVWIADWNANGAANSAIIYEDYDHDGDVDAQAVYYPPTLSWWWGRDDGDDNLLWWDQDYTYYQDPVQDHVHFGGSETFFSAIFNTSTQKFAPRFEAPFYFFDNNGDTRTDEVLRVTVPNGGTDPTLVTTLRWSFNIDANGTDVDFRNYDCSISAHPVANLRIPAENIESATLYGYPFTPLLSKTTCRAWLKSLTWQDGLFAWVENNNNVGWATGGNYPYHEERWEGVIANGTTGFSVIGGPTCGPYNTRYELITAPASGPFEYYFNPADQRFHLKKANSVWLETDWDSSWAGDMKYTWTDTNADGVVDRINFDIDNNGSIEDSWDIATNQIQAVDYNWQAFHDIYMPVLQSYPAQLYDVDRGLAAALEAVSPGSSTDAIWTLINNQFSGGNIAEWKRQKFLSSDRSLIYYLEMVRDRQIYKLKTLATGDGYTAFWTSFNAARTAGNTATMTSLLGATFGPATPNWTPFATWIADLRTQNVQKVDSSSVWLPGGIAWETEQAAWRIINGRYDFYGKRAKALQLDGITPSTNLSTDTGGWGMDALNEGTGPGSGGLTLFVNGSAYPLYGDALTSSSYRVLEQTNDHVTIEMVASNVGPGLARRVRVQSTAQAGHYESQFQVLVQGGSPSDNVELGIGFIRPAENYFNHDTGNGRLSIWGFQTPQIDWIGMGLIYQPADYSRFIQTSSELDVVLHVTRGRLLNYTIQNDWLRGRRFPVFPVVTNWVSDIAKTAASANFPVLLSTVWVDFIYGGPEYGTEQQPYSTLDRGVNGVLDHGLIFIKSSQSAETLRVTKDVTIHAVGGPATIGR